MKLIISGGWSYGNIGDEVIAKSTIELFKKKFSNYDISYTSYNPSDFEKKHNQKVYDSIHKIIENRITDVSDFDKIKKELKQYDLEEYSKLFDEETVFVMSGGGYFSENWQSQFVARLLEIYIAKTRGAKVFVIAQSIGPVYSKVGRELLINVFNLCDYLSVRDVSTKKFLDSLELKIEVDYNPDLAVTISDYTEKFETNQKCINVMPAAYTTYRKITSGKKVKIIEKIKKRFSIAGIKYKIEWKKIIKELSKDYKINFVMSVNWKSDQKFVDYLTDNGNLENCQIVRCETAEEMCKTISEGSLIISTKMHPIIVSVSYGIPAIAVSYDFKVDDFMNMINKGDFCMKNYKFDFKKIKQLIMQAKDDKTFNCEDAKKRVYNMMDKMKGIIEN